MIGPSEFFLAAAIGPCVTAMTAVSWMLSLVTHALAAVDVQNLAGYEFRKF
jgi:hypothetical protein